MVTLKPMIVVLEEDGTNVWQLVQEQLRREWIDVDQEYIAKIEPILAR